MTEPPLPPPPASPGEPAPERRRRFGRAVLGVLSVAAVTFTAGTPTPARAAPVSPVAVFPAEGSRVASEHTQITFRGVPISQLGTVTVSGLTRSPHRPPRQRLRQRRGQLHPRSTAGRRRTGDGHGRCSPARRQGRQLSFVTAHPAASSRRQPPAAGRPRPARRDVLPLPQGPPARVGPGPAELLGGRPGRHLRRASERAAPERADDLLAQRCAVWLTRARAARWRPTSGCRLCRPAGADVVAGQAGQRVRLRHRPDLRHLLPAGGHRSSGQRPAVRSPRVPADRQRHRTDHGLQPVYWDARSVHGSVNQVVLDGAVQEIDIKTGLVLFQWDSLDHVPVERHPRHPPR